MLVYPTFPIGYNFPRPDSLSKNLASSQALSENVAFIRADLDDVSGNCRFGELILFL